MNQFTKLTATAEEKDTNDDEGSTRMIKKSDSNPYKDEKEPKRELERNIENKAPDKTNLTTKKEEEEVNLTKESKDNTKVAQKSPEDNKEVSKTLMAKPKIIEDTKSTGETQNTNKEDPKPSTDPKSDDDELSKSKKVDKSESDEEEASKLTIPLESAKKTEQKAKV